MDRQMLRCAQHDSAVPYCCANVVRARRRRRGGRMKQRRTLMLTLAVAAIVVATWSYVFLHNSAQQTLDQRVHDVGAQLKCPICQGESVADSPSQLAQQMRGVIRQQLQSG